MDSEMIDQPPHHSRSRKRVDFVSGVTLVVRGQEHHYPSTKDISMDGVFICTDEPLAIGENGLMVLNMECGELNAQVKASFKVVRRQKTGESANPSGMGILFTDLESDSSITLFNIVRYQDRGEDGTE